MEKSYLHVWRVIWFIKATFVNTLGCFLVRSSILLPGSSFSPKRSGTAK